MLAVQIGLLILTGVAAAAAVRLAVAARDAESGAKVALKAAKKSAKAAQQQASAAEVQAGAAEVQAGAAVDAASSATRQATAAESRLQQTDSHRAADRRADAVMALTRMLYREVELARDLDLWMQRAFLRFANGEEFIRAYALLPPEEHDVVRWVGQQRELVQDAVDHAGGEVTGSAGVGRFRAQAAKIAAEAAQELLNWQRGDRDVSSFTAAL